MKLTTKRLKLLIVEELEEIKSDGPVDVTYGELMSAVQDVLYREPPQGEQPMNIDKGGMVKNPNKLAAAVAQKIFKMLNPNFEE